MPLGGAKSWSVGARLCAGSKPLSKRSASSRKYSDRQNTASALSGDSSSISISAAADRRSTSVIALRLCLLAQLGDRRRVGDLLDVGLAMKEADALALHCLIQRGREVFGCLNGLRPAAKGPRQRGEVG